jgi:DNA polymerase III sliding clamp (beta) subunit (PCNA family)
VISTGFLHSPIIIYLTRYALACKNAGTVAMADITSEVTIMRLPEARIENAVSRESNRYTLQSVQVDVEHKRVMATDGHILAIVPCEVSDKDHSVLLTADSIKQIRAMQKRAKSIPVEVLLNGKAIATGKAESAEYDLGEGRFPNVDMVIPKYDDVPPTITLNVDLLYRLAKAMTAPDDPLIVTLTVKDSQSSVLVKASCNPEAVGVIMPCRTIR